MKAPLTASTGPGLDLRRAIGGERARGTRRRPRPREVAERAQRRGEGAPGGVVERAVGTLEARADHRHVRMRLEHGDHGVERARGHGRVRVEGEQVGRRAAPRRPRLVAAGEAEVLAPRRSDRPPGYSRGDHLGRAVARGVVDDDHVHRARGRMRSQRARGIRAAAPASGRRRSRRRGRRRSSGASLSAASARGRRPAGCWRRAAARGSGAGGRRCRARRPAGAAARRNRRAPGPASRCGPRAAVRGGPGARRGRRPRCRPSRRRSERPAASLGVIRSQQRRRSTSQKSSCWCQS